MVETPITSATKAFQGFLNEIDTNLTTLIPDPGEAGTIAVTNSGTLLLTTVSGVESRVLPPPSFVGQKIDISLNVNGGTSVNVTASSGFDPGGASTTLNFSAVGQSARIYAVQEGGALVWRVLRADSSEPTLS